MKSQFDFKKEWEKTKTQLLKFSQEAAKVAQQGEKELIKFSKKSKLHIDSTAASLRKEKLYYLIGKEYAKSKDPAVQSSELKKLLKELQSVNKGQKAIARLLKGKKNKKKNK